MKHGLTLNVVRLLKSLKALILGITLFGASLGVANAAFITGSFGVGGSYSESSNVVTLGSVVAGTGTLDFDPSIGFSTPNGNINNSNIDLNTLAPVPNLFDIGGWQFDLESLVVGQQGGVLELDGTGFVSNLDSNLGFDKTPVVWGFTGNDNGSSYSMTITAVPVPAAVWLFGSGLLGLVGIARRRV
jgi:hypothetical protein